MFIGVKKNNFCSTHRSYDPMQYPLLLPYRTDGYSIQNKSVSAMKHYAYRSMSREDSCSSFREDVIFEIESEKVTHGRIHSSERRFFK